MSRTRTVNGVKHARGCCCPTCDPRGATLAKVRADRAAAPAIPTLPIPETRRPRAPLPPFETAKTARFRELLRAGVGAAAAMKQIDAETKGETT